MRVYCGTCNTEQDALFDSSKDRVVCMECGNKVEVSSFMLKLMQSDTQQHTREVLSFPVQCNHCKEKVAAMLNEDEQCVCSECGKIIALSSNMIVALQNAGRYVVPPAREPEGSTESVAVTRDA